MNCPFGDPVPLLDVLNMLLSIRKISANLISKTCSLCTPVLRICSSRGVWQGRCSREHRSVLYVLRLEHNKKWRLLRDNSSTHTRTQTNNKPYKIYEAKVVYSTHQCRSSHRSGGSLRHTRTQMILVCSHTSCSPCSSVSPLHIHQYLQPNTQKKYCKWAQQQYSLTLEHHYNIRKCS